MRSYYEDILKDFLPRYFKYRFEFNIRPNWLKNPKTGYNLELDAYSEKGNIAIEVNGTGHYNPKYPNQKEQAQRDQTKETMLRRLGIRFWKLNTATLRRKSNMWANVIENTRLFELHKDGFFY